MRVVRAYALNIYVPRDLEPEDLRLIERTVDELLERLEINSWSTIERENPEVLSAESVGVDFGVEE